jgi:hypothetical protein
MDKNIVLALDVSTETIGICLILDDGSEHGKIIELTHISPKTSKKLYPSPIERLFIKKRYFADFIKSKQYDEIGITKVVIEEPLISSNNSNTVATLLRFNGMISDCIYEILNIVPVYISSYEARAYSFPDLMAIRKYSKSGKPYENKKIIKAINNSNFTLFGGYPWDVDKKFIMQSKVRDLFPKIEWQYNKKGALKKENFDATDAYVAGLGQIHKERYGELNLTSSNVKIDGLNVEYDVEYWGKTEHRKTFLFQETEQ